MEKRLGSKTLGLWPISHLLLQKCQNVTQKKGVYFGFTLCAKHELKSIFLCKGEKIRVVDPLSCVLP
jgi:hypothetical protein